MHSLLPELQQGSPFNAASGHGLHWTRGQRGQGQVWVWVWVRAPYCYCHAMAAAALAGPCVIYKALLHHISRYPRAAMHSRVQLLKCISSQKETTSIIVFFQNVV
jgi:hypothetical protein